MASSPSLARAMEVVLTDILKRFDAEIVIPSDSTETSQIQDSLTATLEQHRFSEREIFAIKLAVEEALVNAMKHGNQLDRTKSVRVAFHVVEETFYIRIQDEGRGFDPSDVPDPTEEENLERPCGRGLLLMRHYMSAVHFLNRGTTVLMWKRRHGSK